MFVHGEFIFLAFIVVVVAPIMVIFEACLLHLVSPPLLVRRALKYLIAKVYIYLLSTTYNMGLVCHRHTKDFSDTLVQ